MLRKVILSLMATIVFSMSFSTAAFSRISPADIVSSFPTTLTVNSIYLTGNMTIGMAGYITASSLYVSGTLNATHMVLGGTTTGDLIATEIYGLVRVLAGKTVTQDDLVNAFQVSGNSDFNGAVSVNATLTANNLISVGKATISSGGSVIGTIATANLQTYTSAEFVRAGDTYLFLRQMGSSGAGASNIIDGYTRNSNGVETLTARMIMAQDAANASVPGGRLTFHTNSTGGALNETMRINQSGNIGIGTTSPSTKLEVAGTVSANKVEGASLYSKTVNVPNATTTNVTIPGTQSIVMMNVDGTNSALFCVKSTGGGQGCYTMNADTGDFAYGTTTNPGTAGKWNVWVVDSTTIAISDQNPAGGQNVRVTIFGN